MKRGSAKKRFYCFQLEYKQAFLPFLTALQPGRIALQSEAQHHLPDIYDKNEKADLNKNEIKDLRKVVEEWLRSCASAKS